MNGAEVLIVAIVVVSILSKILEIAIMRILNDAILQEQNVITSSL